jgi:hypothetical protein
MLKRSLFLVFLVLTACNPPAPKENVKSVPPSKPAVPAVKAAANYWPLSSYALKQGETERRKYVSFATEGYFSDTAQNRKYLYAELLIDKKHAGIFLHKLKKSAAMEKFSNPVRIKMTNSSGQELQLTSSLSWNNSGGILIERNNNDYSQLRIFLLQSTGTVKTEIADSGATTYSFVIYLDGFKDSFSKL